MQLEKMTSLKLMMKKMTTTIGNESSLEELKITSKLAIWYFESFFESCYYKKLNIYISISIAGQSLSPKKMEVKFHLLTMIAWIQADI